MSEMPRAGLFLGFSQLGYSRFIAHRSTEALMHAIHGQRIDVCQLLLENKAEFQHVQSSGKDFYGNCMTRFIIFLVMGG